MQSSTLLQVKWHMICGRDHYGINVLAQIQTEYEIYYEQ